MNRAGVSYLIVSQIKIAKSLVLTETLAEFVQLTQPK
jgi:hypothetical protein